MNNNNNTSDQSKAANMDEDESEEAMQSVNDKLILTKQIIERAYHLTECIPEQDLIGTMLLKKSKYTHDFLLLSKQRQHRQ